MQQPTAQYFDLSHFSLLEISGKDAFDFIHGQFVCDLHELEKYGWLFTAWCLPNGRVICTFIIFADESSLFLILPSMLKDIIIRRLGMYVLRSDVSVSDVSDNYALFGISGKDSREILDTKDKQKRDISYRLEQIADISILKLWEKTPRCIIVSKIEAVTDLLNQITPVCTTGKRSTWSLMDIETGIPWITNATSENYLPQMLNIDQMHGLSLKKGCYPGQEIIARLHYRGQLKKKMFLGTGSANITPGAGDQLLDKNTNAIAADIIDAESESADSFKFLAVADTGCAENNTLVLRDAPDITVNLQPIIYPA